MFRRVLFATILLPTTVLAQTTAIRAGHLIDPTSGAVRTNQVILVMNGKITDVGPSVNVPAGATVIDLPNSWVMPGLMDAHTHMTFGSAAESYCFDCEYLRASSALRALNGLRNAQSALMAGFTALKDIGNDANYTAIDIRRAIERGWFAGPTMLTTGKIIAPFGGQLHNIPAETGPFWRFEYQDADTPDEVRKAVRQNIFYGANAIKLVADSQAYFYSVDEIRAAVEEAHKAGLTVAVHVFGGVAARNVILGGADSIEHGEELSDQLLQLMKEKGTFLVGADFPIEHLRLMRVPQPEVVGKRIVERLRRAYKIGVKVAFGTDVVLDMPGKTRADMMFEYLQVWTDAGVPPADILKAMTSNVMELFRWKDQRGAIAAGQAADIIATPANPLDDIHTLRRVQFVMKDGKVVRQ